MEEEGARKKGEERRGLEREREESGGLKRKNGRRSMSGDNK